MKAASTLCDVSARDSAGEGQHDCCLEAVCNIQHCSQHRCQQLGSSNCDTIQTGHVNSAWIYGGHTLAGWLTYTQMASGMLSCSHASNTGGLQSGRHSSNLSDSKLSGVQCLGMLPLKKRLITQQSPGYVLTDPTVTQSHYKPHNLLALQQHLVGLLDKLQTNGIGHSVCWS